MPQDPLIYTPAQIRSIGQTNSVPNYDTMPLVKLGMYLYDNGMITQEMLQARQDYYRANGTLPSM